MALLPALVAILATGSLAYLPHDAGPKLQAVHFAQDHYISDALLREVVDRMGKDLAEAADSYMDFPGGESRLPLMSRAAKDLESEQFDYDSLSDGNPNPSLRDQEYLQHSTLWGQYVNGPGSEGSHVKPGHAGRLSQQLKADAALPAYCNPPNPCPVGYTEEQGCTLNFENTAAFSREYQSEQECMCDGEHMFECPGAGGEGGDGGEGRDGGLGGLTRGEDSPTARLDYFLAQQLKMDQHKNLVAKKFHAKKSVNPYLDGEKLPVAAKKGINVDLNMD